MIEAKLKATLPPRLPIPRDIKVGDVLTYIGPSNRPGPHTVLAIHSILVEMRSSAGRHAGVWYRGEMPTYWEFADGTPIHFCPRTMR